MSKHERKKLARHIARQVIRELARVTAPPKRTAPRELSLQEKADAILTVWRAPYIAVATVAGWDAGMGDFLFECGVTVEAAARLCEQASRQVQ